MSTSTSASASTLTRPRVAIAIFSVIGAVSLGYYSYHAYRAYQTEAESVPGPGLHRSNAVRRTRRHSLRQDDSSESETHADENTAPPPDALAPLAPGAPSGDAQQDDDWFNDTTQAPRQRTGENIVTLLFRVSEDNARRNAYVHRGCQCNGCGMVPIRGIRYRCANCADFDLCEVCESQGMHNKTHVFYKVRVPAPPFGPRQVQPSWYPGDPDNAIRQLPRHLLQKWSQETGFERVELDAFWEQWTFMANTEWKDDPDGLCLAMDRKTFERCLVPSGGYRHAAPNLIHDRMFAFYDTKKDDLIDFEEFLHGVSYRKRKDKLRRTFEGYDIDGDGYVNRRDFLRMFRAYYVLYKQMHRDILEGLDDHMMTTTEAQQLVSSRAPLSSLFGREGRVPAGDHSRPMEGKVFRSTGEVDIHDGKVGVVNENKPDTSGREEILSSLFARNSNQSFFTESFGTSRRPRSPGTDSRYWAGIINPPQTTVDLASLINGDYSQLDDVLASIGRGQMPNGTGADDSGSASSDDEHPDTPEEQSETIESGVHPTGPGLHEVLPVPETGRRADSLPNENQLRAQHRAVATPHRLGIEKRKRVHARRQLHERWKRRQFYLDEEEGAIPPSGWDDNEDVLVNLNGIAESSKSTHVLSPRSRSSSKVRFAEDTDDFDIRSNPSTSSRSVPERWGGMEIPDAERDAGKEILYQVTQQAFNELLDEIFRNKEDLAVHCAETKSERDKNRHLFEHIQIGNHQDSPAASPGSSADVQGIEHLFEVREGDNEPRPYQAVAVEATSARPVGERTLDELLASSGYTVNSSAVEENQASHSGPAPDNNTIEPMSDDQDRNGSGLAAAPEFSFPNAPEHRDPTMPQFMPNSEQASSLNHFVVPSEESSEASDSDSDSDSEPGNEMAHSHNGSSLEAHSSGSQAKIPQETLEMWKRFDLAEEEAKERGGWGRINYEEFEKIYKEHEFADSNRNRLDYLGSWIDFCIP